VNPQTSLKSRAKKQIKGNLIKQLTGLKYANIADRRTLEENFRSKFEPLNKVCLTDSEFFKKIRKSYQICQIFYLAL
jgi:hypothetical protein